MERVYFDNAATTKPYKEVIDEMVDCLENEYGNPSAAHKLGFEAEKKIKTAREKVAKLINSSADEIIFTSGGSESNNIAIRGILKEGDHIITSSIEHSSVGKIFDSLKNRNIEVTILPVDKEGLININELKESIKDNTKLVSLMYVNNEIGSIEPIKVATKLIKETNRRTKIHVDGVQALGKIPIDVKDLDIDMLSLSAHKIHGPKGVGALYIRKGLVIDPLIIGGGQEMKMRGGTENVPGISGFGVSANITYNKFLSNMEKVKLIKERFISLLEELDDIIINSPIDINHVNNILSVSFEGIRGEVLLHSLEDYGIFVSTGSACSAKKASAKNHILESIGLNEKYAKGTIRFSFSHLNTLEEVDYTVDAIKKVLPFLRRIK